jgi:hypothetical protein
MGRKKGFKISEITREKLRISHTGKKHPIEQNIHQSNVMMGKKHSIETRQKISESHKGEKCYKWKGGVTPIYRRIRNSIEFRLWREAVFSRDNWTCQECGVRGTKLHPHHIKSFAYFPELRFAIDNGITLCISCHEKTDNYKKF